MNSNKKLLSIAPVSLLAISIINIQSAQANNICSNKKDKLEDDVYSVNCEKSSIDTFEKLSDSSTQNNLIKTISTPEQEDIVLKHNFSQLSQNLKNNLSQENKKIEIKKLSLQDKSLETDNTIKQESIAQQLEVESSDKDPNFINPPKIVPDNKVNPFVTTIPINGNSINHLTKWKFHSGYNFGSDINNHSKFKGIVRINSQIKYSVTKDNVFTSEQTGNYLQLQTVRKNREITTTQKFPQTLQGFELQLTFTGNCIFPDTNSDDQCSYIPTFSTRDNINPDTFLPSRITVNKNVGEILTPESVEAIEQPGFQTGANGQNVAFDLYIPRAGVVAGNTQTDRGTVDREEEIDNTLVFSFSRVRQIVKANDKKAVIGRTVRSTNLIVDDDNFLLNSAIQLGSEIIPDIEPQLEGSTNKVKPIFNKNLFLSANNSRVPANSLTIYHGGIGKADNPKTSSTKAKQLPAAEFKSFWLGLSPITKYSYSTNSRYEASAPQRTLSRVGAEGSSNSSDRNLSFQSIINGETFSSADLLDFYIQIYQSYLETDVNLVNTSIWKEEINYYPHLSITGNITDYDEVFNYYGGTIFSEDPNAYLGLDYTKVNPGGWLYRIAAIGYTNPDRDYYSTLQGSILKNLNLNKTSKLLFSTGFNWALDRREDVSDILINSRASSVTLGAKANFKPVSLGIVGFLGDILPDSRENTLLLNLGVKLNKRFSVSGYLTPISESSSYSKFGAKASLKLTDKNNSPRLNFNWFNNKYEFGKDQTGQDLKTDENIFQIQFSMGSIKGN